MRDNKSVFKNSLRCVLLVILCMMAVRVNGQERKNETDATVSPQAESGTLVFLDGSMSMRGYFKANGELPNFQRFFQNDFRNILSGYEQLVPLYSSLFGVALNTPKKVKGFFFTPADFSDKDTDIISVFRSELFGKYPLTILITDGVQSDPEGGYNTGEMGRAIRERLNAGFFLYLIGAQMEFDGKVYSETNRIKGEQQISVNHQGKRPIYFWFATRDRKLGASITAQIARGITKYVNDKHSIGIINFHQQEFPTIEDVIVEEFSDYHTAVGIQNENGAKSYDVEVIDPGKEPVKIPVSFKSDASKDTWDIILKIQDEPEWAKMELLENTWNLVLDYRMIPRNRTQTLTLKVIGVFNPTGHWWKQWSTSDDLSKDNAEKTLYLDELVWGMLTPLYADENGQKLNQYKLKTIDLIIQRK